MGQPKPPWQAADAAESNPTAPYLLFAPPPAVARMKFVWLKTLKAFASNLTLTLSVILKVFDRVISAAQLPGPTKLLRPRVPAQPRHGVENVTFGPEVVMTPLTGSWSVAPQPFAQLLWLTPPTLETLALGRSFLPWSKLKSPPMLKQVPAA